MPLQRSELSKIRNKVVRGQLLAKAKREKAQAKLKRRIARKEAEQRGEKVERGWTRTIENTKEWLGDSEEYADPRTRPAKVEVNAETGDVKVDLGTLSTLFPSEPSTSALPAGEEPKILITTSPAKPPCPFSKELCIELQSLFGGKKRADFIPRKSPKFELGRVARWARGRGYGAIVVVGEDHNQPSSLTLSLLPAGPTAHFRLTGVTLSKDIKGHAKPTSHPPELVLNNFSTPLGLSLASLVSQLFLPPSSAEVLADQGYAGRQVVLAQNSRDFVFIRRYRYMFALKSDRLGSKKKVGLEKQQVDEDAGEVVKTRFQEMGPRMTIKMRWIKRGALGETQHERVKREKEEAEQGLEKEDGGELLQGEMGGEDQSGEQDEDEAGQERSAAKAIGLDGESGEAGQPMLDLASASQDQGEKGEQEEQPERPKKTRKRKRASHPLLRPESSGSPPPDLMESEPVPLDINKKGKKVDTSLLRQVGKTWHPGKGEGGIRDAEKNREWAWDARMQVSRRKFFL